MKTNEKINKKNEEIKKYIYISLGEKKKKKEKTTTVDHNYKKKKLHSNIKLDKKKIKKI